MCYFSESLIPKQREETIIESLAILSIHQSEFDAIAFRGVSGAVIAPILAWELDKVLIPVRKFWDEEDSHAYATVEGDGWLYADRAPRVVIVDDFISSGTTINTIHNLLTDWRRQTEVVAVYLYCGKSFKNNIKDGQFPFPFWTRD